MKYFWVCFISFLAWGQVYSQVYQSEISEDVYDSLQNDLWAPGKLFLMNGKTLEGNLTRYSENNQIQIKQGDFIKTFGASEVQGFYILCKGDTIWYASVDIENGKKIYPTYQILAIVEHGKVSLLRKDWLSFTAPISWVDKYYIQSQYFLFKNGNYRLLWNYKKHLIPLLQDSPETMEYYKSLGKIKRGDWRKQQALISFYNANMLER